MSIVELDERGRLTIPKGVRRNLDMGGKVLIINAGDHLKIIPLPPDPLKTLHGAFNTEKTFSELRRQAERSAAVEARERRPRADAPP
ncbi:MAG: AbrB/MazE/SpoVT family DNA-binding domain-containing protein [Candidatus Bathyarchaeota archaeon]|nr:AbrB/MazE/SpoVT family DNA-binding domain-containing protein [Candidatus Bathyarchaeota archaeon]